MPRTPTDNVRTSVKVSLTQAEERDLRARATTDLRSLGSYVASLVVHDLEHAPRKRRLPMRTSAKRHSVSIGFTISQQWSRR